jgi:hypothetical protein
MSEERRKLNRELMPETTKIVDGYRRMSEFVRLNPSMIGRGYFVENGRTVEWGTPTPDAEVKELPRVKAPVRR